jgi:predicted transcriptional regulator
LDNKYPHDLDAERAVLGAALLSKIPIDHIDSILRFDDTNWFYEHKHNVLWSAIIDLHESGKPIDQILLLGKLGTEWITFFADLVNSVPASANMEHYAETVRETYERRQVIAKASQAVGQASNKRTPIYEAIESLESVVADHKPAMVDEIDDEIIDPGPIPEDLLYVPGFIHEVMEYSMSQAHYPNRYMAFCGALSLLALLTGRKVTDTGGTRTNLYTLGLANSGTGKEKPRKVNVDIMENVSHQCHDDKAKICISDKFSSPEGIEDSLLQQPNLLWQCDEINGMIKAVGNAKDTNRSGIMNMLLQLYTSSGSSVGTRRRANDEKYQSIINPNFNLLGTAVPNHFYESLSEDMLDNGFFARMLIVEDGADRVANRNVKVYNVPQTIISKGMYWWMLGMNYHQGEKAVALTQPILKTIHYTEDATDLLHRQQDTIDKRWSKCNKNQDSIGTSIWGRAFEMTKKLALIYACSKGVKTDSMGALIDTGAVDFEIDFECVAWASQVIYNQSMRMIYKVNEKSYGSDHEKVLKKVVSILKLSATGSMKKSDLLRKTRISTKDLDGIIESMVESEIVKLEKTSGRGRPAVVVKLK